MIRRARGCIPSILAAMVLALAATGASAQGYKAETFKAPPPEELAAALRGTLQEQGVRVTGPGGTLCEIWWRKGFPIAENPQQGLGIVYGKILEGNLLGAVRFPGEVSDYRQQHIHQGVYTMRYALIPVDGNHQGVAPNRDFVLLSPASDDSGPKAVPFKDLVAMSRKASGTGHPSVWSLVAPDGAPASLPAVAHREDADTWVLYFNGQLQKEDGALTVLPMAMVVVGHAPEA